MESYRTVQLDMLKELDQLCRKHNIPYILSRHTARAALLDHALPNQISVPTIGMHYRDALRLTKLTTSPERKWESSLVNRNIPRTVLRYSDTSTLMFRADEANQYTYHGLSVDVELIRHVPANALLRRLLVIAEAACATLANTRNAARGWKALLRLFMPFEKAVLRFAYGEHFPTCDRLRIARYPKKNLEFPLSFLINRQEIMVADHMFYIPEASEQYMRAEYDDKWHRSTVLKPDEDLCLTVLDPYVSSTEVADVIREVCQATPQQKPLRHFLLLAHNRRLRLKIEQYWAILFLTKDRFDFHHQLMPRKKEILRLYQEGRLEETKAILKHYLAAIDKHYAKGLVLCFDEEILNIALDLLRKDGKDTYAQKLRNDVFPEHLKPMKIED